MGDFGREGGIYLWILGESVDWTDIGACNDYAYTGIVLDNADGNPMTSPETGGVLYASFIYEVYDWDDNDWRGPNLDAYRGDLLRHRRYGVGLPHRNRP
jgi:hypothetical protein